MLETEKFTLLISWLWRLITDGGCFTRPTRPAFQGLRIFRTRGTKGFGACLKSALLIQALWCHGPVSGQQMIDFNSTKNLRHTPTFWIRLASEGRKAFKDGESFGFSHAPQVTWYPKEGNFVGHIETWPFCMRYSMSRTLFRNSFHNLPLCRVQGLAYTMCLRKKSKEGGAGNWKIHSAYKLALAPNHWWRMLYKTYKTCFPGPTHLPNKRHQRFWCLSENCPSYPSTMVSWTSFWTTNDRLQFDQELATYTDFLNPSSKRG